MSKLHLEVIQPAQKKIDSEFDHIIIPGIDGDFGVYIDHTPFITQIRPGILQLFNDKSVEKYAIHDGFVTIENNKIVILCEVIEKDTEVDEKRAISSQKRAEERIKSDQSDINFRRAEASLRRAFTRLEAIRKDD